MGDGRICKTPPKGMKEERQEIRAGDAPNFDRIWRHRRQVKDVARPAVDIDYKNIDISHSLIDKLTFAQSQFKKN